MYRFHAKEFATHYIVPEIPWKIIDLESESVQALPIPFKNLVLAPNYLTQSEIKLKNSIYYKSSTKTKIPTPTTTTDVKLDSNNNNENENVPAEDQQYFDVYKKATNWCSLNEKLVLEQKYYNVDCDAIKKSFTLKHQKAINRTKKIVSTPNVDYKNKKITLPQSQQGKEIENDDESNHLDKIRNELTFESETPKVSLEFFEKLQRIFNEAKPIELLKISTAAPAAPTQYQLVTTNIETIQQKAKEKPPLRYWKKNKYPPKTKAQIIAERRRAAPPIPAEYNELDYLHGIWEASFMKNEFNLTGVSYDSRVITKEEQERGSKAENYEPIDWYQKQLSNEKCQNWLNSIVD